MSASSFTVIEFHGQGDPMFGGLADDRPLGPAGLFITGSYNIRPESRDVARFPSHAAAEAASAAASNKRPGGRISILPSDATANTPVSAGAL